MRSSPYVGALLLAPLLAAAGPPEAGLHERIAPIFAHWDRSGSPGAAVAAYRENQVLFADGFGLASLEFEIPVSTATAFNAGSIAKQFTATAILMLEAEGRLSLDDQIRRYVPELPRIADSITLRQLLHHTSGLRDIWALTDLGDWLPSDVRTQEQALRLLSRQKALNFPPGSSFSYSNSGYILLAEAVARISGEPFPSWVTEHVFAPVGMMETYFYQEPDTILRNAASSYRSLGRERGFLRDVLNSGMVGGGNVVTTVADLARWANHLLVAKISGTPLLQRLSEQPTLPGGFETGYGMGLFTGSYRELPVVHHGGASAGYRSHLLIFTDERVSIIILGNVNTLRAGPLARQVADIVLEDRFTRDRPDTVTEPIDTVLPPGAYVGLYDLGAGLLLDVRESQGQLYFLLRGVNPRRLVPAGPHSFVTAEEGVRVSFEVVNGRRSKAAVLQVPGRILQGPRLVSGALTAREARAYEGLYFSEELETYYVITGSAEGLVAQRLRADDIPLTPLGDDRFIQAATGDLIVRFTRTARGRVRGFAMSVERARGVEFAKQ